MAYNLKHLPQTFVYLNGRRFKILNIIRIVPFGLMVSGNGDENDGDNDDDDDGYWMNDDDHDDIYWLTENRERFNVLQTQQTDSVLFLSAGTAWLRDKMH